MKETIDLTSVPQWREVTRNGETEMDVRPNGTFYEINVLISELKNQGFEVKR